MFKVGDEVKLKDYDAWGDHRGHRGQIATILEFTTRGYRSIRIRWADGACSATDEDNLISISNQNFMSSLKQKFTDLFLAEPEKSFRKAGITNESGMLTSEGQEVFLTWLLKKNGELFKSEVVDKILEEKE